MRLLLTSYVLLLAGVAGAQAPLTRAAAVRQAEATYPPLQAAQAQRTAATARQGAAGRSPNPTLLLAPAYGSPKTGGFGEDITLSQTLELPGKLGPRRTAAAQTVRASDAELSRVRQELALQVSTAYIECLRADAEVGSAEQAFQAAHTFTTLTEHQFTAGDAPRSNVVRSQLEEAHWEQVLTEARTDRDIRYATLRSLLGQPAATPLLLAEHLTTTAAKPLVRDSLLALARSQRPEVLAAQAQLHVREAERAQARGERQPDVVIEGRRASINPGQAGSASVRVGVSLPLLDNGRIRAEVRAADAAIAEQEAVLRESERQVALEVETALREREQAQQVLTRFEGAGRLARAQELVEMARIGYEKGNSGYWDVIDAQRTAASERVEYLRAQAALLLATIRLERAIGGPLP